MLNQSSQQLFSSPAEQTRKWQPEEWQNDERMKALFAPFRNRDLNPLHYDGKLNFWKKTIVSFLSEASQMTFNQKCLEETFVRNGTKPKCLNLVLEALQKERKILSKVDFLRLQEQQQQGWASYAFDKLVWSPLSWTTKYIVNTAVAATSAGTSSSQQVSSWVVLNSSVNENDASGEASNTTFVFIELVDKRANQVHEHVIIKITYPELDCVIDYEKFQEICTNELGFKSQEDVELILANLVGKKRVIVSDTLVKDKKLIKFAPQATNGSNLKFTELETSYYVLKLTELKFDKQINLLNFEIENVNKEIKLLLKQKLKQQALKLLKKRKNLEKQVDLKHQQLDNLHQLKYNMQQADTHKMAISVFTRTVETMKNVHKEIDLDKVDDLILDIQDNLKLMNEVDNTLSRSVVSNDDDQELEDELNELLKQKPMKFDDDVNSRLNNLSLDDLLNDLPNVPDDSFSSPAKLPLKTTSQN